MEQVGSCGYMVLVSLARCYCPAMAKSSSAAGSGKTVLWLVIDFRFPTKGRWLINSSTIIEALFDYVAANPSTVCAYYYFDFNESEKRTFESFIRSLTTQLLARFSDIPKDLLELYSQSRGGKQGPLADGLRQVLQGILRDSGEVFLVIDALDECLQCEELLQFIDEIKSWELPNVRLIVASRQHFESESLMNDLNPVRVSIQDEIANDDILAFIQARLEKEPKLKFWPPELKAEIEELLLEKACGM
jgi:hypothetical protein